MHRLIPAALAAALVLSAGSATAADPKTDDDKTLYALGLLMARDLATLNLSAEEAGMVASGLTAGATGADPAVDLDTYGPKIQGFAQARIAAGATAEKEASAAYVQKMADTKGAETTDSGLVYIELSEGSGPSPAATDTVRVHYHGTLRDGTVFDSSVDRGEPISFALNGVIPCWTEGVQKMKVGGKSRLICPSDIAYGDRGAGADIKPGAALNFEVELLGIEPPATP